MLPIYNRILREEQGISHAVHTLGVRQIKLLEKNHNLALVAFQLEQIFRKDHTRQLNDKKIQKILKPLQQNERARFEQIIRRYIHIRDDAQRITASVVLYKGNAKICTNPPNPQMWGKSVFYQLTKKQPAGRILCTQKHGLFILNCFENKDFEVLAKGRSSDTAVGFYKTVERIRLSRWKKKVSVPLAAIRQETYSKRKVKQIEQHELQHFINDFILSNFVSCEPSSAKLKSPRMTFKKLRIRSVKDELLAWIKEGASGSEIQNQLLGENYKDLLVNLTAEEKVATQKSVRAVAEFLDVHARWFSSLRARSIFVYQLASLSFERLSLWIPKIAAYYRLKEKELERQIKTACKAHWDIQHQTVQNTPFPFSPSDTCGIVPSHLKEQWEQEKPNIRLYVGIEERIREQRKGIDVVTNTNKRLAQKVEEQISLYRGTCSLLVKSLHKIAVNNQMPPIATEIYLMQGDDYLDDVVDGGTEADLKLRQKVLDEVCTVYTKDHTLIKEKISTVVASFVGIKSHEVKFHSAEHGEGHDIEVRVHYTNPQGETQHTAIAFTIRCTLDPLPEI